MRLLVLCLFLVGCGQGSRTETVIIDDVPAIVLLPPQIDTPTLPVPIDETPQIDTPIPADGDALPDVPIVVMPDGDALPISDLEPDDDSQDCQHINEGKKDKNKVKCFKTRR